MLWILTGAVAMVTGFSARIALTYYPTDLEALGPYLVQQIVRQILYGSNADLSRALTRSSSCSHPALSSARSTRYYRS